MKSLTECSTNFLEWRRGDSSPLSFELRNDDGTFATLVFLDKECILARVETAEGTWTLKHLGVMNPVVTLREEGGKVNLATFHPHAFRHGKLEFQDGAVFDWTWHHGMGPGGTFTDQSGLPMVRLHARTGRDLTSAPGLEHGDVELNTEHSVRFRFALLAAFGWYLILFDHLKVRDEVAAETALRL
ncbi:hypothetical protein [Geothrix fuzhouensis]|uniref:hypothetical protein n=1 Tax=Geothrix fuzhouensis TaxID=2966451 RepID=UPI00214934B8|nr:hypothetical protein [Geothrix fuzhouensis]